MTTTQTDIGKALLQGYVDSINSNDLEGLLALFAEDVQWEDPYGSEPVYGRAALREVYAPALDTLQLRLDTPIRGSHGDRAAMAFTFEGRLGGKRVRARAIDVITVNNEGLIAHFQAYWAPDDLEWLDDEDH